MLHPGKAVHVRELALLAAVLVSAPAGGGTFTTGAATVTVTTTVASNCTISATAIAFGSYDPVGSNGSLGSDLNVPGTITIQCLKSSSPTIALGQGSNFSSTRRLRDAPSNDFLSYELYQPSTAAPAAACTYSGTIWGTSGTYGVTFTPAATWSASSPFTFNVCGSIPRGQNPSIGIGYQDTVVATVNF